MAGINPFVVWGDSPDRLIARKDEIRAFNSFLGGILASQPSFLLLFGPRGSGKSALLDRFKLEADRQGVTSIHIKAERGETFAQLLTRIVHETEGGALRTAIEPIYDLESLARSIETHQTKRSFGTILMIDDIDIMQKAEGTIATLSSFALKSSGIYSFGIILSATKSFPKRQLPSMQLGYFSEPEAHELVTNALKDQDIKMGEECIHAILADSDGNPKVFKIICWYLFERRKPTDKVISKAQYLAYIPSILNVLNREWFGRIYHETPESEKKILGVLAQAKGELSVTEIARLINRPLGQTTALVGRLVDSGQLIRISRGRYKLFTAFYGRYILQMITNR